MKGTIKVLTVWTLGLAVLFGVTGLAVPSESVAAKRGTANSTERIKWCQDKLDACEGNADAYCQKYGIGHYSSCMTDYKNSCVDSWGPDSTCLTDARTSLPNISGALLPGQPPATLQPPSPVQPRPGVGALTPPGGALQGAPTNKAGAPPMGVYRRGVESEQSGTTTPAPSEQTAPSSETTK